MRTKSGLIYLEESEILIQKLRTMLKRNMIQSVYIVYYQLDMALRDSDW
jgi:hypothetical protein